MSAETYFVAVGKHRNLTVKVRTTTYLGAVRACKQIFQHNPVIDVCHVEDRKGNTLKVVER